MLHGREMSEGTNPRLIGALCLIRRVRDSAPVSSAPLVAQCRVSVYARVRQFVAQTGHTPARHMGHRHTTAPSSKAAMLLANGKGEPNASPPILRYL